MFLVDDDEMIGEAVERLLRPRPEFRWLGQALDWAAARLALGSLAPSIVLLDVGLTGAEAGSELLEKLRREHPALKVVMFSGFLQSSMIERSLESGARGYIVKDDPIESIISALREVAAGGLGLSPTARRLAHGARGAERAPAPGVRPPNDSGHGGRFDSSASG